MNDSIQGSQPLATRLDVQRSAIEDVRMGYVWKNAALQGDRESRLVAILRVGVAPFLPRYLSAENHSPRQEQVEQPAGITRLPEPVTSH